jgi:hypothetical protein
MNVGDWIPCSERLPAGVYIVGDVSESLEVLVTLHGCVTIARLERYDGGASRLWRAAGDHVLGSVTYWMPLPIVPREP